MSGIQQNFAYGRSFGFPNGWPANIGDAYGGGYFAGQINVSGTKYNLVVAPKASGESTARTWGVNGVTTGQTSVINGPTNTAVLAALGSNYQAALFCTGLSIGGYTDWYLPATNEIEVLYYFLKPNTQTNNTSFGSNANAVSPEPISTTYTSGDPAQTSANGFKVGQTNAFEPTNDVYWTSTEYDSTRAFRQYFDQGVQNFASKENNRYVRAVRRVLA